jgi:uncharacterized protein YjbI with pentapeptide repeats
LRYAVQCHLPVDSGNSSLCILHDPDPNKEAERFTQALREKIEGEAADPGIEVINLAGAVFLQEAGFRGRGFTKAVTFAGAKFTREADFVNAQFVRGADFVYAQFGGGADFAGARFGGAASFEEARFRKVAHFWSAQFGGEAYFGRASFGGGADFWGTSFGGVAFFERASFGGLARFSRTVIKGLLSFVGRETFPPGSREAAAEFYELEPESAHRLRFQDVDLSRVSLRNTDISQVQFVGCTWAQKRSPWFWPIMRKPSRWGWLNQKRAAIYEELNVDRRESLPLVAEQYRQLRLNYEKSLQEVEAGHFYIGQMEMRRQDPTYYQLYRCLLGVYRVLSLYGESYLRPPVFYLLFGIGFALAYLWGGFQVGQSQVKYQWLNWDWNNAVPFLQNFVRAYVHALTAGGLVGTNLAGLSGANLESAPWWVPAVRYLNMVVDTFLLGFFVIALRRRFHR